MACISLNFPCDQISTDDSLGFSIHHNQIVRNGGLDGLQIATEHVQIRRLSKRLELLAEGLDLGSGSVDGGLIHRLAQRT